MHCAICMGWSTMKAPYRPLFTPGVQVERVSDLLTRLGNPYQAYPTLHVAGTKGKGSVSSILAGTARAGGLRAGRRRHTCIPTASASRSTVTPSHAGAWPGPAYRDAADDRERPRSHDV